METEPIPKKREKWWADRPHFQSLDDEESDAVFIASLTFPLRVDGAVGGSSNMHPDRRHMTVERLPAPPDLGSNSERFRRAMEVHDAARALTRAKRDKEDREKERREAEELRLLRWREEEERSRAHRARINEEVKRQATPEGMAELHEQQWNALLQIIGRQP